MQQLNPFPKGITPGLAEKGKIKIGQKGQWINSKGGKQFQPPQKLDHFRVVTLEQGPDGNFMRDDAVHRIYGEQPAQLSIFLLYNDISLNFQSRLVRFQGRQCVCQGDNETSIFVDENGEQKTGSCPCHKSDPTYQGNDTCKISSKLQCQIVGVESIGGVYTFRTTSYNSFQSILSSLMLIHQITGGYIANIPLRMELRPKVVTIPTTNKSQTVYVVALEYPHPLQKLREAGEKAALAEAQHNVRMQQVEEQARQVVSADIMSNAETQVEMAEEYYPETAQTAPPEQESPQKPETVTEQQGPNKFTTTQTTDDSQKSTTQEQSQGSEENEEQKEPEGQGGGNEPEPSQGNQETTQQSPPARSSSKGGQRKRTKKWSVDYNIWGTEELKTCGVSPEQIQKMRELSQFEECKEIIKDHMHKTEYSKYSFLKNDEANTIIQECNEVLDKVSQDQEKHQEENQHKEEPTEPSQEEAKGERYVFCPKRGKQVNVGDECAYCGHRRQDGFCPALGEKPPDQNIV